MHQDGSWSIRKEKGGQTPLRKLDSAVSFDTYLDCLLYRLGVAYSVLVTEIIDSPNQMPQPWRQTDFGQPC